MHVLNIPTLSSPLQPFSPSAIRHFCGSKLVSSCRSVFQRGVRPPPPASQATVGCSSKLTVSFIQENALIVLGVEAFFVHLFPLLSISNSFQMKIIEANAGPLTNFEVLDFLRAKGASKDPTRVLAKVAQSEYKVYDYLVNTAACDQTRESVNEFLEKCKRRDLAKAEVLNILNIRPTAAVEIFPIIEKCEDRFPDEEIEEIVELVKKTLPPPPAKLEAEGVAPATEETAALTNEKDGETSQSQNQNENGEQMDTS